MLCSSAECSARLSFTLTVLGPPAPPRTPTPTLPCAAGPPLAAALRALASIAAWRLFMSASAAHAHRSQCSTVGLPFSTSVLIQLPHGLDQFWCCHLQ